MDLNKKEKEWLHKEYGQLDTAKFIKGYFENGKRINVGTVNSKPYKIYLNDKDGTITDMIGNLNEKDLNILSEIIDKSVSKSEREYGA